MQRHRLLVLAVICLFWTGLIIAVHFLPGIPFLSTIWRGEQSYEDLLRREGRKTATQPNFVFVGIDESSREFQPFDDKQLASSPALRLMAEHPFPWNREVWALLIDRLVTAGAKLIMFDITFSSPNESDPSLRAVLDRYRDKVVLAANFDMTSVRDNGQVKNIPPNGDLIPAPQMEDDRVGYIVFFPDRFDDKIRSIRYSLTERELRELMPAEGETPYFSLSARAAQKLGHGADVPPDLKAHMIRFTSINAYQPRPLWEIFDEKVWQANYGGGAFFKDKIVMVGMSAQIQHDVFDTPISPETPGPVLHLHSLGALLDHEFLTQTPLWVDYIAIAVAGAIAWLLVATTRRPLICILALVGCSVLVLVAARLVYDRAGLFLPVVPTLAGFLLSGIF